MATETVLACVQFDKLFLHPLLEDAQAASTPAERTQQHQLAERARTLCAECPMLAQCRYDAVVKHDVSGFVAGTTPAQRLRMRRLLNVKVVPENFDSIAGAFAPNRQVDSEDVVRLRQANPDATLEQIAERLSCSLSTVKRHLRKVRSGVIVDLTAAPPSIDQVNAVAGAVAGVGTGRSAA